MHSMLTCTDSKASDLHTSPRPEHQGYVPLGRCLASAKTISSSVVFHITTRCTALLPFGLLGRRHLLGIGLPVHLAKTLVDVPVEEQLDAQ